MEVTLYNQDNLELMSSLSDNHIDLIYCDILYGTGKNFGEYQDLKPIRSEIETHYIPRIKEMHRILKDTGSIYLQMDLRIVHWLRCIMDDIFGYKNFRNEIIWSYKKWPTKINNYLNNYDIILFYSKSDKYDFNIEYINCNRTGYNSNTINKNNKKIRQLIVYDKESVEKLNLDLYDNIIYSKNQIPLSNVWVDINLLNSQAKERLGYDTQKPKALIERIVKASSNEGDLVADFYMGSGTTAVVCKELNRKFIGCDINPRAIEITKNRLKEIPDIEKFFNF